MLGNISLPDLLQKMERDAPRVLAKEPENFEEALLRMLILVGNLWMQGEEPISSELDRLLTFWTESLRWDERQAAKLPLHQLRRVRKGLMDAKQQAVEGGSRKIA